MDPFVGMREQRTRGFALGKAAGSESQLFPHHRENHLSSKVQGSIVQTNTDARSKRSNRSTAALTNNCGPSQTFHRYASFPPFQSFKTFQPFHRFAPFQTLKIEDCSKVLKQIRRGNFHVSGIRETSIMILTQ